MKNNRLIPVIIGLIASTIQSSPLFHASSFLSPRSTSTNAARELVGWRKYINRGDMPGFYSAFYALGAYEQSYRPNRIAEYFFGQQKISISGSLNTNRNINDLLADYFGLSPAFVSDVIMFPKIITNYIELNWYAGYSSCFFRIHVPFVWEKTFYKLKETVYDSGQTVPFPALYMADTAVTAPATSFSQAIETKVTYGQVEQGLNFNRIAHKQCKNGVSEPQLAWGYNVVADDLSHIGFEARLCAPTGNSSKSLFLFEPIIGNGRHWEAGIGFTGHWVVWEKDIDKSLAVYLDINLMHKFKAKEIRSFDFKQHIMPPCTDKTNWGSRYILLKEFDGNGNYTGNTIPGVNVTTLPCKVKNDIYIDLALMLGYSSYLVDIDLGYGAWVRSKEEIELCASLPFNKYGLKGVQNVALAPGILSNATQSNATINGNYFTDQVTIEDNPSPVFVNTHDINLQSAANPTSFTHKIFWNISHAWENEDRICRWVIPFLGFGGESEFESLHPRRITEPNQNSISQWALWIKGGVTF